MMHVKKVTKILEKNLYMNISTCSLEGLPWISAVYFAVDQDWNFYWYSPVGARHSQNIRGNSKLAISIYDSSVIVDDIEAVFIEADVKEIANPKDLLIGASAFGRQGLKKDFIKLIKDAIKLAKKRKDFMDDSPLRLYKASAKKIWLLAPSEMYNGHYVDSRVEVEFN